MDDDALAAMEQALRLPSEQAPAPAPSAAPVEFTRAERDYAMGIFLSGSVPAAAEGSDSEDSDPDAESRTLTIPAMNAALERRGLTGVTPENGRFGINGEVGCRRRISRR